MSNFRITMSKTVTTIIGVSIFLFISVLPAQAQVSNFTVRPFFFDEDLQPRDVITKEVALTNDTTRRLNIYATINEITLDTTGEIKEFISPVMTDRTLNATSWIEITRGRITLEPGEATTTPITFRVNAQAKPGDYNVFVGFVDTNKRATAEETALRGDARGIPVKISIDENIKTALAISAFKIPRFIFRDSLRDIELSVTNNGEAVETPTGEIIFYNTRGEEVASVVVNEDNESVNPEEEILYSSIVPLQDTIGRFTANVNVRYGNNNQLTLFDTTEFFIVPWYWLFLIVLFIVIFSVFVTYLLKRAMEDNMTFAHEEVDLPVTIRTGFRSEDKDHDITLPKK